MPMLPRQYVVCGRDWEWGGVRFAITAVGLLLMLNSAAASNPTAATSVARWSFYPAPWTVAYTGAASAYPTGAAVTPFQEAMEPIFPNTTTAERQRAADMLRLIDAFTWVSTIVASVSSLPAVASTGIVASDMYMGSPGGILRMQRVLSLPSLAFCRAESIGTGGISVGASLTTTMVAASMYERWAASLRATFDAALSSSGSTADGNTTVMPWADWTKQWTTSLHGALMWTFRVQPSAVSWLPAAAFPGSIVGGHCPVLSIPTVASWASGPTAAWRPTCSLDASQNVSASDQYFADVDAWGQSLEPALLAVRRQWYGGGGANRTSVVISYEDLVDRPTWFLPAGRDAAAVPPSITLQLIDLVVLITGMGELRSAILFGLAWIVLLFLGVGFCGVGCGGYLVDSIHRCCTDDASTREGRPPRRSRMGFTASLSSARWPMMWLLMAALPTMDACFPAAIALAALQTPLIDASATLASSVASMTGMNGSSTGPSTIGAGNYPVYVDFMIITAVIAFVAVVTFPLLVMSGGYALVALRTIGSKERQDVAVSRRGLPLASAVTVAKNDTTNRKDVEVLRFLRGAWNLGLSPSGCWVVPPEETPQHRDVALGHDTESSRGQLVLADERVWVARHHFWQYAAAVTEFRGWTPSNLRRKLPKTGPRRSGATPRGPNIMPPEEPAVWYLGSSLHAVTSFHLAIEWLFSVVVWCLRGALMVLPNLTPLPGSGGAGASAFETQLQSLFRSCDAMQYALMATFAIDIILTVAIRPYRVPLCNVFSVLASTAALSALILSVSVPIYVVGPTSSPSSPSTRPASTSTTSSPGVFSHEPTSEGVRVSYLLAVTSMLLISNLSSILAAVIVPCVSTVVWWKQRRVEVEATWKAGWRRSGGREAEDESSGSTSPSPSASRLVPPTHHRSAAHLTYTARRDDAKAQGGGDGHGDDDPDVVSSISAIVPTPPNATLLVPPATPQQASFHSTWKDDALLFARPSTTLRAFGSRWQPAAPAVNPISGDLETPLVVLPAPWRPPPTRRALTLEASVGMPDGTGGYIRRSQGPTIQRGGTDFSPVGMGCDDEYGAGTAFVCCGDDDNMDTSGVLHASYRQAYPHDAYDAHGQRIGRPMERRITSTDPSCREEGPSGSATVRLQLLHHW